MAKRGRSTGQLHVSVPLSLLSQHHSSAPPSLKRYELRYGAKQ